MPSTDKGFNRIYGTLLVALTLIVGCVLWEGHEIGKNQVNIRLLQIETGMLTDSLKEQQRQGKQLDRIVHLLEVHNERR